MADNFATPKNTSETLSNSSAFYISQASLPARPGTPSSSLRDSSGAMTMGNTTPLSSRRSKNPLYFFRKKSHINMREDGSECHTMKQELQRIARI